MKAVEAANPDLRDVLPRGYQRLEKATLTELLRLFAPLPRQLSGRMSQVWWNLGGDPG